jgi:Ca2+-binding RTX toxin-like protein
MGGAFSSASTTAGTVIFWAFHTYASSNVLSNWRHAQRKEMPVPNSNIDPTQLIDVNFLVDTSSSYTDDLPQFKVEVPDLIDDLDTTYDNIHFGLGHYADYPIFPFGDGGAGDLAYERLVDLSPNGSSVKSAISGLTTTSGNDYPESQLVALYQSATGLGQTFAAPYDGANIASGQQSNFRTGAIKVILLFTDADFHRQGDAGPIPYPGPGFDETANAILALDPPMVVGISSGGGGLEDLKEMALATGATAPAGGTDCDGDGVVDIAEGEALVCVSPPDSAGIGDILAGVLDSAVEEAEAKETDGDGVQDLRDNCIYDANADQADVDNDGIGDVCDADNDNDGANDDSDNCPSVSNSQQLDTDSDGEGDLCDDDDDDDGIVDELDACPTLATTQVINGTAGNDTLVGTAGNDMIFGYAGNDEINGGGGDDCIVGGSGDDELIGAEGDDIIFGGAGDDRIHGKVGDDNIYAEDGADVVFGCEGFDVIEGGAGDDRLYADGHEASDHGGPIVEEPSCTAPAWRANKAYTGGQKVSYQGEEYTAHYWTRRKKPANHSGSQSSGKPWSKGTSCASSGGGDTGVSLEDFSKCDATAWKANKAYTGGQTVSYQGVEYTAHYWTKGRAPDANSGKQASGKPWSVGESCLSWEAAIAACGDELTDGHGHHGGAHTGASATPHAHDEETILGGEGNDRIYGGPANDALDGGPGLDLVCGGAGDDHAMGGSGMDVVVGGSGDDALAGNTEDDLVIGGLGDDGVSGGVGSDWLIGNEGDDLLDGGFHEMGDHGHGHGHGHDSGVIDTCIGGDGLNEFNNCEQISGASPHGAHGAHGAHGHDLEPAIDAESVVEMLCAYKAGPQNSSGFPYGYGLTALGLLGFAQWRRRKTR